jgi:3-isopropylmalate/(R)-2-methylmalate dehydratase small subunit
MDAMQPFTTHRGTVGLLDWADVDTDKIIPARYLKRIERTGYGPLAFADKRYVEGQAPPADDPERTAASDPAFPLNEQAARGATVLLVGRNFGCGSSREHAVWAIAQAGYRVLIAPGRNEGFADIFEQNAFNNGLLPIELAPEAWAELANMRRDDAGLEIEVDLETRQVVAHPSRGGIDAVVYSFDIPETQRQRLLKGLDAIGETLAHAEAIARHEATAPAWVTPTGGRG